MFSMKRKADKDKVVDYDQTPKETVNINKPSEVVPSYQGTIENRLKNPDKFELEAQRRERKRRRMRQRVHATKQAAKPLSATQEIEVRKVLSRMIPSDAFGSFVRDVLFDRFGNTIIDWGNMAAKLSKHFPEVKNELQKVLG